MKKQLFLGIASLLLFSSFAGDQASSEQAKNVYICSNPKLNCYFVLPCKDFSDFCSDANGKMYKVTLERAEALGKEKCDCADF
jgi:hypothetical protein